jgi:hypothetical protein
VGIDDDLPWTATFSRFLAISSAQSTMPRFILHIDRTSTTISLSSDHLADELPEQIREHLVKMGFRG